MSTITTFLNEQERQGLLSMAQEIEEGNSTLASVSRQYSSPVAKDYGTTDLASRLVSAANPPFTIAASQIGPLSTGSIGFADGVAVGGNANLTLFQNGAFNFSGHFHVSGAISYNTSFVWAVMDLNTPATVHVYAHQGRVHGTFEAGSRDDDWGRSEISPALAAGWGALMRGYRWRWEARVNADFGVFLDDIIRVVAAGQAIGNVVKIFI